MFVYADGPGQITRAYPMPRWRRKLFAKLITTASSTLSFPPYPTHWAPLPICGSLLEGIVRSYLF